MFNNRLIRNTLAFWLVLVQVPLSFAASESESQAIRYYAKLAGVISPMLEYTPRGEVSAQRAKTINHYRVKYDLQGRIAEMRFFQGDKPSSSSYFGAHKVSYQYQKNKHTRSYFDENDSPASMSRHYYRGGDVHREQYTHSGNTRLLKIYNHKDERISVGTGSYEFSAVNLDANRFIQRQFKTDGSANIIFDYLPFEVAMITKDNNGHLYQIINLDANSLQRANSSKAGFTEMRLRFDQYGNEMGWDFRDTIGKLINRPDSGVDGGYANWEYKMDWNDRELGLYHSYTESYQKADGTSYCKANDICSIVTYQDNWGNFTGWEYLNNSGSLVKNPDDGYAKLVIDRDSSGDLKAIKYLDEDGNLRSSGIAETRYQIDNEGNSVETNFDAEGKQL